MVLPIFINKKNVKLFTNEQYIVPASDSVDLRFKIADFNNGTLLHYSSFHGLLMICHLLLLANFEIDEFDKEQNTPLMLAISSHKNDVVNYLIRAGANISLKVCILLFDRVNHI